MLKKIVSGGQTGVDRAALDAALAANLPSGGWCPKGRLAEDGIIDRKYPLRETGSSHYPERTRKNIEDSDGTLIIADEELSGGTLLTRRLAEKLNKPCLVVSSAAQPETIVKWLNEHHINILNVAGPRASASPGIYRKSLDLIHKILS